ncbi:MAG: putative tellurite resistance protein B-like protein [Thermoproteota archaeon]|jgi:uncharacterized tellurite resistance protein B-like protein
MAFWDLFSSARTESTKTHSTIYLRLKDYLPGASEEKLVKVACISGLIARVIHADLKIDSSEIESFKKLIKNSFSLDDTEKEAVVAVSLEEVQELIDIENHLYTNPLHELLSEKEKYKLLELLFEISAADGIVDNVESEEIRLVTKGLRLTDQHFLAARATVKDKLGTNR